MAFSNRVSTNQWFALTLSGLLAPVAFSPPPVIGPQVRIDVAGGAFAANETSAAANPLNPLEVVGTWNDWRRSTASEIINMGVAVSLDGGVSWTDFLVRPPLANQSNVEGDPMTCSDPRTGNIWVGAISFASNGGVYVARKNVGASTFQPSVMARATASADKCWMTAGPVPGNPDSTRLYIAYNQGVIRSDDLGATWSAPVSLGSGLGFLPRVGPAGELYVAYWNASSSMLLRRSFDGGLTFQPAITIATRLDVWGTQDGSRFPGRYRAPSLGCLAVDPNNGTLYYVYFDTTNIDANGRNVNLYFTKSTMQGAAGSWSVPVVINGDTLPAGDQYFNWLECDSQGRLHMVFNDTRGIAQVDDTINGLHNCYYSYSDDGGATWHESRLTPSAWNSNNDGLNRTDQFIGDYLGLAVAGNRAYPCYLSTQNGNPDIFVHAIVHPPAVVPGDMNCDGVVDILDINPFILALGDPAGYAAAWPDCNILNGDINGDGDVDILDINPFIALID